MALAAANELVDAERAEGFSSALLRALRWSSIPLTFSGDKLAAIAALQEAYGHAERLGLEVEMWHTAEYMTDLAFEDSNLELAQKWVATCVKIYARNSPNAVRRLVTLHALARVAVMASDYDGAVSHLQECWRVLPAALTKTRAHETLIATELIVGAHRGLSAAHRRLIARLRRLHIHSREWGFRDYETGALLTALRATGEDGDSALLGEEYVLRYRRSRLPLSSALSCRLNHEMQSR